MLLDDLMSILVECIGCGKRFQVGDEFAGRQVECACGKLQIVSANPLGNPLNDLTPQRVALAPNCPGCGAELTAGAVLCVACGLDLRTGQTLGTSVGEDLYSYWLLGRTRFRAERDSSGHPHLLMTRYLFYCIPMLVRRIDLRDTVAVTDYSGGEETETWWVTVVRRGGERLLRASFADEDKPRALINLLQSVAPDIEVMRGPLPPDYWDWQS